MFHLYLGIFSLTENKKNYFKFKIRGRPIPTFYIPVVNTWCWVLRYTHFYVFKVSSVKKLTQYFCSQRISQFNSDEQFIDDSHKESLYTNRCIKTGTHQLDLFCTSTALLQPLYFDIFTNPTFPA